MRKLFFLAAVIMAFAVAVPVMAQEQGLDPKVNIFVDAYNMDGNIDYEINFVEAGVNGSSKLEFPIDNNFLKVGVSANLLSRVDLTFDYAWSVSDDAGTFKDTDYSSLTGSAPWVIGKADADLDGKEWNIDFKYLLTELQVGSKDSVIDVIQIKVGLGHKNQKFEYDIRNLKQHTPLLSSTITVPGKVLEYDAEYTITYLSLYADLLSTSRNMRLILGAEHAPNAELSDRDDHILRSKLSEAEADGTYTKFAAKLDWNLWQNLYAAVYFNYIVIDLSGDQDQRWYDGSGMTVNNIDYTNDSEQTVFGLQTSWLF